MKSHNFTILFISYLAILLSGCAINKSPAPIEYHHNTPAASAPKSETEKTISRVSQDEDVISDTTDPSGDSEIITPIPVQDRSALPQTLKSVDEPYKIIKHPVKEDETLEEIASSYGQTPENVALLNGLAPPYEIEHLQTIRVKVPEDRAAKMKVVTIMPEEAAKQIRNDTGYIRPAEGTVIIKFGEKTSRGVNKGINIAAPPGTAVVASATGKIIYADFDATFGNLVFIKLDNKNIILSYAHLEDIKVSKGLSVKQGDIIGHIGKTGKVEQPQLYFAVREGKNAVDPLKFVSYSVK